VRERELVYEDVVYQTIFVEVWFLKRAQIFISKTWGRFNGKGYGQFDDIHSLTMFADYRYSSIILTYLTIQTNICYC
jgi:hypothetical protein